MALRPQRATSAREPGREPFRTGWSRALVGHLSEASPVRGVAATAAFLVVCYAASLAVGGANAVPPHWFYFPIIFAGVRFGVTGAVVTAVLSGVLAGPLLPADVAAGDAQFWSDYLGRAGFFVAIGAGAAVLLERTKGSVNQERTSIREVHDLAMALRHREFELVYQPVVELATGRIAGVEALLRRRRDGRLVPPNEFIPQAEASGMIVPIGEWVLHEAAARAAEWQPMFDSGVFVVSVNVSGVQLEHEDFTGVVSEALRAARVAPHAICLEITETAFVHDLERSAARLEVLTSLGIRTAVDDFGIGHASLAYLHELPLDVVKIDRSFVRKMVDDPTTRTIVQAIVDLAGQLGKKVTAEGVETPEQAAVLQRFGCPLAQGYAYSEPLPAAAITDLLRASTQDTATLDLERLRQ